MPRPRKWRTVCEVPRNNRFGPLGADPYSGETVQMTVDEYEAVRLIDMDGLTQEECAVRMHVARTTVQGIYESARKKIASAIVDSKELRIEGGEYRLCDGTGHPCARRRRRNRGAR